MPKFDPFAASLRQLLPADLAEAVESSDMPSLSDGPRSQSLSQMINDPATSEQIRRIAPSRVEEIRSALWLLAGDIDRSHSISQGIDNAEGSFLHGIMHRREGDFGNAKYWFRRAGSVPIIKQISEQTDHLYSDPIDFVDQCSRAAEDSLNRAHGGNNEACALTHAQWVELQSILSYLLNDQQTNSN